MTQVPLNHSDHTPFEAAAQSYLDAGWFPMPVGKKGELLSGATGYDGTVTPEKVARWLTGDRTGGRSDVAYDNVSIRHDGTTMSIDVDVKEDKDGATDVRIWATGRGLPPLPATISSTARIDSPSRQYLYRVPPMTRFVGKPCGNGAAVEICQNHNRHTVCWPSVHQDTGGTYAWYGPGGDGYPPSWGARLDRIPSPNDLAMLPAEYVEAWRAGQLRTDPNAVTVEVAGLLRSFAPGKPDGLVAFTLREVEATHIGHDEFKAGLIHAIMLGREGNPGVPHLILALVEKYRAYVEAARPGEAAKEIADLVGWCVGTAQRKALSTPLSTTTEWPVGWATSDEVMTWLTTYTRRKGGKYLRRRVKRMNAEPLVSIQWHVERMMTDTLEGLSSARDVTRAVSASYMSRDGSDRSAPGRILAAALGRVLRSNAGAR